MIRLRRGSSTELVPRPLLRPIRDLIAAPRAVGKSGEVPGKLVSGCRVAHLSTPVEECRARRFRADELRSRRHRHQFGCHIHCSTPDGATDRFTGLVAASDDDLVEVMTRCTG